MTRNRVEWNEGEIYRPLSGQGVFFFLGGQCEKKEKEYTWYNKAEYTRFTRVHTYIQIMYLGRQMKTCYIYGPFRKKKRFPRKFSHQYNCFCLVGKKWLSISQLYLRIHLSISSFYFSRERCIAKQYQTSRVNCVCERETLCDVCPITTKTEVLLRPISSLLNTPWSNNHPQKSGEDERGNKNRCSFSFYHPYNIHTTCKLNEGWLPATSKIPLGGFENAIPKSPCITMAYSREHLER